MQLEEEWRTIPGYEGIYEVSSFGRVRSLDRIDERGRRMKGRVRRAVLNKGYEMVGLHKFGEKFKFKAVHRIVAEVFVSGENETVNHIDGNKLNNRRWNLEWVSNAENYQHAVATGLIKPWAFVATYGGRMRKPIVGVGPSGEGLFLSSITKAEKYGFDRSTVNKVVKGHIPVHKGWFFVYM